MIIKFKPKDFEECLMGLPIENWLLVDDVNFTSDQTTLGNLVRPKMMISHLDELRGIKVDDFIHIKGYTELKEILNHEQVPKYFKQVLTYSKDNAFMHYYALGDYMTSMVFDRCFYPMLIGIDAYCLMKSYKQERLLELRKFTQTGKLQFANYDEIIYEFIIPTFDYTHIVYETFEHENIIKSEFSYFMGIRNDVNQTLDISLMLPNQKVLKCHKIEDIIEARNYELTETLKVELLQAYIILTSSLSDALKKKDVIKGSFEKALWLPLNQLLKGSI